MKMIDPIKCKVCKSMFKPKSVKEIICSEVCRQKYKRDYHYDRYAEMKEARNKKKGMIKCRQCGGMFQQTYKRVFCSPVCRVNYRPPVKPKKPKKYDLPHAWKVNHPYKMFKVESRFESELQKAIEKQELDDAVNKYLENGGEIKKLEELPAPTLPSVGSREWEWEVRVGLGFVGPDEGQDYVDVERLEYLVSKVG
tara:strand:+ start:214 stop:801 length:588 start_codon:yes stop_codon:yes gene_type:complete